MKASEALEISQKIEKENLQLFKTRTLVQIENAAKKGSYKTYCNFGWGLRPQLVNDFAKQLQKDGFLVTLEFREETAFGHLQQESPHSFLIEWVPEEE